MCCMLLRSLAVLRSLLGSILKCSVLELFSRWAPLVFGRITRKLVLSLVLLFLSWSWLSSASEVKAQAPTCDPNQASCYGGTWTPTPPGYGGWEPIYKTPTPRSTRDYTCPTGLPSGWLTKTPSWSWSQGCSNCVRPTISSNWPTFTPNPIYGTPTVSGGDKNNTSTPTSSVPTSTPTPSIAFPSCSMFAVTSWQADRLNTLSLTKVSDTPCLWRYDATTTINYNNAWGFQVRLDVPGVSSYRYKLKVYGNGCGQIAHEPNCIVKDTLTGVGYTGTLYTNKTSYIQSASNGSTIQMQTSTYINDVQEYELWYVRSYTGAGYGQSNMKLQHPMNSVVETKVTYLEIVLSDPTPTPAPTVPSTYCQTVEENTPGGGAVLPYPVIGPPTCYEVVPGVSIDLTWLPSAWNMPASIGVHSFYVCTRQIEFGVLEMFGLSFDLDIIAGALLAVAALRIMMR